MMLIITSIASQHSAAASFFFVRCVKSPLSHSITLSCCLCSFHSVWNEITNIIYLICYSHRLAVRCGGALMRWLSISIEIVRIAQCRVNIQPGWDNWLFLYHSQRFCVMTCSYLHIVCCRHTKIKYWMSRSYRSPLWLVWTWLRTTWIGNKYAWNGCALLKFKLYVKWVVCGVDLIQ